MSKHFLGATFHHFLNALLTSGCRIKVAQTNRHCYSPLRLRCIQCFKAPHLAYCEDTVNCNATQICYVEQRIVYGQTLVFAGCKERSECDSEGCFGDKSAAVTTRWSQGRELKCHHCCDSSFCNMYGCPDTFDVSQLKGSRCFTCEQTQRPEICENITNCGSNEVCIMEKFATGYEMYYRLACERKSLCTELAKVKEELHNSTARRKRQAVKFYSQCCSSHLCNGRDPIYDAPPSPLSQNYTCRSPPPLTTSTTQSTTRTTPTTISTQMKTSATTITTTESQKVVPIHGSECRDKSICTLYDTDTACSLQWRDWARETCPRMCNLCSGSEMKRSEGSTTPVSTTSVGCRDRIDCTGFSKDYACRGQFIPWAKYNCPVHCGLCPAITTTDTPGPGSMQRRKETLCEDRIDCTIYGKDYACGEEFKEWATSNCPNYCGLCSEAANLPQSTVESRKSTTATLLTTLTVTSATLPTTLKGSVCEDRTDCSVYGKDYACSEEFREWATYKCPNFCGLCAGSPKSAESVSTPKVANTHSADCKDKIDCSIYGKDYACSDEFTEWATENCPKFCNRCNETASTSSAAYRSSITSTTIQSSNCIDKIDCGIYGHDYICTDEFKAWATSNCPSFCGYC